MSFQQSDVGAIIYPDLSERNLCHFDKATLGAPRNLILFNRKLIKEISHR